MRRRPEAGPRLADVPERDAAAFAAALAQVRPTGTQLRMLRAHAAAASRRLSADAIGRAGGHAGAWGALIHYGGLARELGGALGLSEPPVRDHSAPDAWIHVLARALGRRRPDGAVMWGMHEPLAQALAQRGLI